MRRSRKPICQTNGQWGHLFTKKDSTEVQQLLWFTDVRELLRKHKYAERPIRRMTEAELFLKSMEAGEIDPCESVPPECLAADFLKVIHLLDPELEVGLYTKLEGRRLEPQGRALGRQSQESDDEDVKPAPYCSGCGGDGCWMGADRCRRQRKPERLRALVDLLVEKCRGKIAQEFAGDVDSPLHTARIGG